MNQPSAPAIALPALIKNLPEILRQPTNIGILASLGVHAVAAIAFSVTPPATPEAAQRKVQLIELTPEEQRLLPQVSTPQISLPSSQLPTQQLPLANSPTKLPAAKSNSTDLYNFNPSPPPPLNWPPLFVPPTQTFYPPYTPPITAQKPIDNKPSDKKPDDKKTETKKPEENRTEEKKPAANEENKTASTQGTVQETKMPPGDRPSVRSETIPPAAIARLRELQAQQQQFAYNATGTSEPEVRDQYLTWVQKVWKDKLPKKLEIAASLPAFSCTKKVEATTVMGVLADAEGKIVDQPVPIQSSGYPVLNQTAMEAIKAHSFEKTTEQQAYLVYVKFPYDPKACPDPSAPAPAS